MNPQPAGLGGFAFPAADCTGRLRPDRRVPGAERDLWTAYGEVKAAIDALEGGSGAYDELRFYGEMFTRLGALVAPIDRYFDDVLVMDEDEKLRRNRLAMCWNLAQLFRRIADFSLVVQA